jgi:hypothetical protein
MTRATNATERVVEISGYLCGARLSTSNTATASSSEVTVAIAPLPSSRDNSSLKRSCLTSIFAISYGLAITTCCGEGFENSIEKCPLWRDRCYTMPPYSMLHTVHCSTPYSTEIWDWIRRPLGIEIRFHAAAAESDCSSDQSHVTIGGSAETEERRPDLVNIGDRLVNREVRLILRLGVLISFVVLWVRGLCLWARICHP